MQAGQAVTLRLVENVSELPVRNLSDVAAMARGFGDDIEAGDYGDVHRAVVIVQGEDGTLTMLGWGENTTAFELMGICEAAKLQAFADYVSD
jgi:hypothetical protein